MNADIIVGQTYDENLALNGLEFKITSKDQKVRPVMLYYNIDQDEWSGTIFEQNKPWSPLNDLSEEDVAELLDELESQGRI